MVRAEYNIPSKSTEITPTMSVSTFRSFFPLSISETLLSSSLATVESPGLHCCDDLGSVDEFAVRMSLWDSSSGVCSCGSCSVDDMDDVVASGLGADTAITTRHRRYLSKRDSQYQGLTTDRQYAPTFTLSWAQFDAKV